MLAEEEGAVFKTPEELVEGSDVSVPEKIVELYTLSVEVVEVLKTPEEVVEVPDVSAV